jgi:hypothetical protein
MPDKHTGGDVGIKQPLSFYLWLFGTFTLLPVLFPYPQGGAAKYWSAATGSEAWLAYTVPILLAVCTSVVICFFHRRSIVDEFAYVEAAGPLIPIGVAAPLLGLPAARYCLVHLNTAGPIQFSVLAVAITIPLCHLGAKLAVRLTVRAIFLRGMRDPEFANKVISINNILRQRDHQDAQDEEGGNISDIFISYRSNGALIARHVAEQLIAAGAKVWFAEYKLLAKDQTEFLRKPKDLRDEVISRILDDATANTCYGLVLTNDEYMKSAFCEAEALALLDTCTPAKILNVNTSSASSYPDKLEPLTRCPTLASSGNINDIAKFVSANTPWKLGGHCLPLPSQILSGNCLGRTYTFDAAGWDLSREPSPRWRAVESEDQQQGQTLTRRCESGWLKMNLWFGREADPTARETRVAPCPGNREMYNNLLEYSVKYMNKTGAKPLGTHLLYYNNSSHIALTYRTRNFQGDDIIIRKYSIIIKNSESGDLAEFVFTFGAFEMPFAQFCRYAHFMDKLVMSLHWK